VEDDVAKYFAIIPAMFAVFYARAGMANGPLQALNIMHLATPQSAILSAIIFNALIIIALIPLALKGVAYRPIGAGPLLRRNLLIYGLGGVKPFGMDELLAPTIYITSLYADKKRTPSADANSWREPLPSCRCL
jgi:high-affinity K+ transport system ATPase subunit B